MRRGAFFIYKLLALDIDGTLINNNMEVTSDTRQAIVEAQNRGIIVTLATGRSFHSAKNYADQLNIDVPLICANGAIIAYRNGHVLQEWELPAADIAPILGEMLSEGLFIQAYHRNGLYTAGHRLGMLKWIQVICDNKLKLSHVWYSLQEYRRCAIKHSNRLPELVKQKQVAVHKLFCSGNPEKLAYFQRKAGELDLTVEYYPGYHDRMYLELMPADVSKGNALKHLADYMNIPMEDTVAVGDNLNDLSMVKMAGLGVAMGNAHPQLQEMADHVTLSNEEDGIAAVIREFILAQEQSRRAI